MFRIDGGSEIPHVDRKDLVEIVEFVVPGNPYGHPFLLRFPDLASQFGGERFPQIRSGYREAASRMETFEVFTGNPLSSGSSCRNSMWLAPRTLADSDRLVDEEVPARLVIRDRPPRN